MKDITNQTLANVIRQLSCLANYAEEILGDAGNTLANQHSRIASIATRVEAIDEQVQLLNPKQIGIVMFIISKYQFGKFMLSSIDSS